MARASWGANNMRPLRWVAQTENIRKVNNNWCYLGDMHVFRSIDELKFLLDIDETFGQAGENVLFRFISVSTIPVSPKLTTI